MANLAAILKSEISRLARRELRGQVDALKKGVTQQRRTVANLRKQVDALERQLKQVASGARRAAAAPAAEGSEAGQGMRFQAKGFKTWRAKSKLSAEQVAKLLDVSAQSIYNWEAKKVRPRPAQIAAIAELRAIGKRQIVARLEGQGASEPEAQPQRKAGKPGRKPGRKPAAKSAAKAKAGKSRRGGRRARANGVANEAPAAA